MAGVRSVAAFSHDWVGGNIRGLLGVAQALQAYVPQVRELVGGLSVVARELTGGPGGWQGQAASAFTTAWQQQAMTAAALEDYVVAVALAIDGLAVELSQLENALEQQAQVVSAHGVRIGADGTVEGYSGGQGLEWATAYLEVRDQALAEATAARQAAAQQLHSLYQQVMSVNPHPNVGDAVTMSGLLADLVAAPTAARREVIGKLRKLEGKDLRLDEQIADAKRAGKSEKEFQKESSKVVQELDEAREELGKTGKIETALSKALDTRVSNLRGFLAGEAGQGKHVGGNTPNDLKEAAVEGEPGALDKVLKFGEDLPVVDIGAALLGTTVGTYYAVKSGQPIEAALTDQAISNTAGTVTSSLAASAVGTEIGSELGAAGGPVGIAVGAIVGYGIGDLTQNLLTEPWGSDMHAHGAVLGTLYGIGHSEAATADDARELAVGIGHKAEHYWDDLFG